MLDLATRSMPMRGRRVGGLSPRILYIMRFSNVNFRYHFFLINCHIPINSQPLI